MTSRTIDFKTNINSSLKELKDDFYTFISYVKQNITSSLLICFFVLLSYGIKLFYYSISIDTEVLINNYSGQLNAWTSIGRYGLIITKTLFNLSPFNPYTACFLMIILMIFFCLTWNFFLDYFLGEKNKKSIMSTVFPIIFLTYPLFAEQFNFILQGVEVSLAITLCSLAIFFITKWIISSTNIIQLILGLICMVWGFGTYQAIVPLYISAALASYIILFESYNKKRISLHKNFFKLSIIKYLLTFIVGYILNSLVSNVFIAFSGATGYLDNSILWGKIPAKQCIKNISEYIDNVVSGNGILYNKLFIFSIIFLLIYGFKYVFSKKKDSLLLFLSVCTLILSPFLLSIYLGQSMIPRSQFSLQFVIAFSIYLFIMTINNKKIKIIGFFVAVFIAFNQGYVVSSLLYTDYMKYQSELRLANKISERIDSLNLGEAPPYPVVFIGSYHPLNTPNEMRGDVIGASFFEWDSGTEFGSNYRILGFMKSIGLSYMSPTLDQIKTARELSETMDAWPNTNSVQFINDLIIVKLSN